MKKRLLVGLIGCVLVFSLVGCGEETTVQVNVSNNDNISSNEFGNFIKIGNHLVYDEATRIVYLLNDYAYEWSYTPYYAPNGLPYRYNPETNTFEEIK